MQFNVMCRPTPLVWGIAGVFRCLITNAIVVATNVTNNKLSNVATTTVVYRHVLSGNCAYVPVATICDDEFNENSNEFALINK